MDKQLCGSETVAIIFSLQPCLFSKDLKSVFDAVLGQDGLIFDDVGWWIRFKKVSDGVDGIDIGHGNVVEGTGTKNQVSPYHVASIVSFIIVVGGGRIL